MKKTSLVRRLTLYPLLAGLVPLILGLAAVYGITLSNQRTLIGNNFKSVAEETARETDLILERETRALQTLALTHEIHEITDLANTGALRPGPETERLLGRTTESLLHFKGSNPGVYVDVILADKNAIEVTSDSGRRNRSYRSERWWQAAYNRGNGQLYLSDFYFLPGSDEARLDLALPFSYDEENDLVLSKITAGGEADGVIKVTLDANTLLRPVIYGVRIGKTGHAMLVSSDATPLICPILPLRRHSLESPLMRNITQAKSGWSVAPQDGHGGRNSIIGSAPLLKTNGLGPNSLGGNRWFTFVRQEPAETFGPFYSTLMLVLVTGFMLISLFLLIGYRLAVRLVNPIKSLQEGANIIGDGNLTHRIKTLADDELGELANHFNEMAASLQISRDKLEHWNDDLEKEVDVRTRELRNAHKKLNQAFAEQKQFISDASHELRTPITIIKGHLELLREAKARKEKEQALEVALEELDRMGRLVENMLMLAKASHARFLTIEPIETRDFLEEIISKAKGIAQREWHLEPVVKSQFKGDKDQITQVFLNLVQNSIYHTEVSDTISIGASNEDGWVRFEVRDTGSGMPKRELPKIFKRFYRVDKARNRKLGRAGLGLSIVEAIVEAHGGKVEVESQLGKGTTFSIWLKRN